MEETSAWWTLKKGDPGYPEPSSEAVSRVMRGNRKTDSRPEASLRRELYARGLRYRKNPSVPTSIGGVKPDLVFPGQRVAVFVDGCFWHSCPTHGNAPSTNRSYWESKLRRNRERDLLVTEALTLAGWVVVRVWEHEPLASAASAVETIVRARTMTESGRGT
jgi:DNA mismatch endonuclease (patch repair protein)